MKLIRCYIENFGNLSKYKLTFEEDITSVLEKNGFGKSTLAAFIRVMFYGMTKSGKAIENNDRRRYQPWNGGTYGGYLEFLHDSVKYRIERSFGESPKFDRFRLYTLEPLAISTRYTEKIGEEIFGIDGDSFEKCILFLQTHGSFSVTPGIKNMLLGLSESSTDVDSVDSAIQQLKSRRSGLMSYRGKSGSVYSLSEAISTLELTYGKSKKAREHVIEKKQQLAKTEHDYNDARAAYEALSDEIQDARISLANNHLAEQRSFLQQQEHEILDQLAVFDKQFPSNGFKVGASHKDNLSAEEEIQFSKLSNFFSAHSPPNDDELEYLEELAENSERISAEITAAEARVLDHSPKKTGPCVISFLFFMVLSLSTAAAGVYFNLTELYFAAAASGLASFVPLIMWLSRRNWNSNLQKLSSELYDLYAELEEANDAATLITDRYFRTKYSLRKAYVYLKKYTDTYLYLSDKVSGGFHNSNVINGLSEHERNSMRNHLVDRLNAIQRRLDDFDQTHGTLCIADTSKSPERLQIQKQSLYEEMERLREQIISINREISALQAASDSFASVEDELISAKQQRAEQLQTVKLLDKAIEHLQLAQYTVTTEYINPLIAAFKYYVQELMDIPSDCVQIDSDLHMVVEVCGAHRELSYFSAGERDLFYVCLKLAVQDVVLKDCYFPLILDDPFANLDEESMERVALLMRKLAQSRQILYFTCHHSRLL